MGNKFGLCCFGGDKRDRTADLLNAIQALSQLSYTPTSVVSQLGLFYEFVFVLASSIIGYTQMDYLYYNWPLPNMF